MHPTAVDTARALAGFIDASPSPFHAVAEVVRRLAEHGFRALDEREAWRLGPGRYLVVRGGSVTAFVLPEGLAPAAGFRIVGAHTDSPNLRVKPRPDTGAAGLAQLGMEIYGGALLNSWLDRDLGLSGRAWVRGERGPEERLFRIDRPVLRVPQLAIHLNREIREEGLKLNPQVHMVPILGAAGLGVSFRHLLGEALELEPDAIVAWDAMCHDVQPSALVGWRDEFVSAPRLDNLCSTYCALEALLARLDDAEPLRHAPVVTFFDHEEVGSESSRGAGSPLLRDLLERTVLAAGGASEDYHRAVAHSVCASADMAHATHPNYPEKHDPDHTLEMNAGPVIKINQNLRYASEGETEALFQDACERADVPFQKWVSRADLACGSTIGPITAARLGMRTVDVGTAQLAMHSAREICGAHDPELFRRALTAFFE